MNTLLKFACTLLIAIPLVGFAQEGAAGSAVADQLAQSSLRMVGSLLAVLVVVALCSWGLRRWRDRQGADSESIEIVSGISLGSKDRVVLLRVGDEQVLVGVSPAGMRRLHVVTSRGQSAAMSTNKNEVTEGSLVAHKPLPPAFNLSLGATQ